MKSLIIKWFAANHGDWTNSTEAAEGCAYALCHPEWLDDSDHVLWDVAVDYFPPDCGPFDDY